MIKTDARCCTQVRVAYTGSESGQVQRNNYQLIKLFSIKWRDRVPLPLPQITAHLSAPLAEAGNRRERATPIQKRSMGMKLLAAGLLTS